MKKKSLLIAFSLLGASTLLLGSTLKPNYKESKETVTVLAYDLEDYKNEAKYELQNYVDLEECCEELREQIVELVYRACAEIDNARREYDVQVVWFYTRQCIDDLLAEYADPEARELNLYKSAIIDYIQNNIDVESYKMEIRHQLQLLLDNCIDNIDYAESKEEVDDYYNGFLEEFAQLISDVPIEPINIGMEKELAIEEVHLLAEGYEFYDYFSKDIDKLVEKSEEAIRQAMTIEEVQTQLQKFKTEMGQFPTSGNVNLSEFKEQLIEKYISYEGERISLTGFVDTNDILVELYETFLEEIRVAPDLIGVLSVYEYAISALNEAVPLLSSLEQARKDALSYIDKCLYAELVWCFGEELEDFVPTIRTEIMAAETIEDINSALGTFNYELSFFPKDVDDYLEKLREELKNNFDYYIDHRMEEENIYLSEDVIKSLLEQLNEALEGTSVNKELFTEYDSVVNLFESFLANGDRASGGVNPGSEEEPEVTPENENKNTGLIVACAVEGGVILLGAAAAAVFLLKKKRA